MIPQLIDMYGGKNVYLQSLAAHALTNLCVKSSETKMLIMKQGADIAINLLGTSDTILLKYNLSLIHMLIKVPQIQ